MILSSYGILSDTAGGLSARAWMVRPRDLPSKPNLSLALISHRTTPGFVSGIVNVYVSPSIESIFVSFPSTIALTTFTGRLSSADTVTIDPTSARGVWSSCSTRITGWSPV